MAALISNWLLTSMIVIPEGPHHGAVAGWLDVDGSPGFAYPEITGYYLSWLSSLSRSGNICGDIRRAGANAIDWFGRIAQGELPLLTRYHSNPENDDWRNRAVFTFDLAMAARGISDSREIVSGGTGAQTLQWLQNLLSEACKAREALPVYIQARCELPTRWSTRPGPYQLKPAAAVLFCVDGAPRALRDTAWNTYDRWRPVSPDVSSPEDLHPALYALEGLVEFGCHGEKEAFELGAHRLDEILRKLDRWPNGERSDVIAQALRLSCWLGLERHRVAALRRRLEAFIDGGRVSFRALACPPLHWNAWSAIFAHDSLIAEQRL
jgi:hypothetical protein